MVKLKNIEGNYKCDECGHIFKGKEAKLEPMVKGILLSPSLMLSSFVYVDKEGKIIGGRQPPTEENQILHCPKCETPHLFGFNRA